jgi:cysteine-rich repeat protein
MGSVKKYLTLLIVAISMLGCATFAQLDEEVCEDVCLEPTLNISYEQCIALVTVYTANGGNWWTHQTNWTTSPDVSTWRGVVLSATGTTPRLVEELLLPSNGLSGDLTPVLQALTSLRRLDIHDNEITSLPATLAQLIQLEELIVAWNQLTQLPDIFTNRWALDLLRAENNQLTSLPISLGNLYELDLLDLSDNQLTSLPTSIGQLDDLDILKIANNNLTVLPNPISDLDQLSLLDAQGNALAVWPEQIEQLTTLESLQLQDNTFTSIPAAVFALPSLYHLNLRNNLIAELPTWWEWSAVLQILDLGVNRLSSLPADIWTLDGLRQLYIHENRLTTLAAQIMTLPALELLHVAFNTLSGALSAQFADLATLTYLDVSFNSLDHSSDGNVLIPDALIDWISRPGFFLNGEGQFTQASSWLQISDPTPFPNFTNTAIVRSVELSSAVQNTLDDEQQPTVIVWWTGALCDQLTATLTLTASWSYELLLEPQQFGVYAWCTIQLVDQWGNLTPAYELPPITFVSELHMSFCEDPAVSVEQSACEALLQLYIATQGADRTRSSGWFVDPRVETWYGIETRTSSSSEKLEIVGIYLHSTDRQAGKSPITGAGNGLRGFIPDVFSDLPDLVTLALGNNTLSGPLPPSLGSLSDLAYLYIQNNAFTWPLASIVSGLTSLRRISVQQNDFSWVLADAFVWLLQLEAIDIRDNSFSWWLPVFAPQAPMFYLHAANNQFDWSVREERTLYPGWQHLYLQGNQLEGTLPVSWASWTWLTHIDIAQNAFNRLPDGSAILDDALSVRRQGRTQKARTNQRDIVAPEIALIGTWTASGNSTYTLTLTIEENNYAIDALGAGMPVVFAGGEWCTLLETTDIFVTTGQATILVTPPAARIYEACTLTVLDHGENFSNTLALPILGHDLGEQSICLHSDLTVPMDECRALRDLWTATNGDSWTNSNNRWQTPDVDSWFGIDTQIIDGEEHIVAILLHRNELTSLNDAVIPQTQGNNLHGTLPDSLRELNYLKYIRADHNSLVWSPRDALVTMQEIEVITLANNEFSGVLPVHRGWFSKLTTLDLSSNAFTWSIPESWKSLPDLRVFRVANNDLWGTVQLGTGDWGSVEIVDLSHNQFTGTLDTDRSVQYNLQELLLADNTFWWAVPASRSSLSWLIVLDLTANVLSGPLPTTLSTWTNIEHFLWSGNSFYGDINLLFPQWTSLEELDITGNKFTGRIWSSWSALTELDILLVRNNHLDRTATHEAIFPASLAAWLLNLTSSLIWGQIDTRAPQLISPTVIWSPVTNAQTVQLTRDENSYAVDLGWSGMQLTIAWWWACASIQINTWSVNTQTGTIQLLLQPQTAGLHTCWFSLVDHAGNEGRLQITPFLYDATCGDGQIVNPEACDEGRFCRDLENTSCTDDSTLCPFACETVMVDNCTPSCQQSVCGDRYIDTDGQDNSLGTQDDEFCDAGKFCADGRDCTENPEICPWGAAGCQTRFTATCSPVCAPSSCGDGIMDEDGENNLLDDEDDEHCDDGNIISGDGCSSSCKVEYCGDGFVDTNGVDQLPDTADDEECDVWPGNDLRAGQCNQFCKINEQTCQRCFETCQWGTGQHSIYLLIDVSWSMEGNKMEKAKQWAIDFIDNIVAGAAVNSWFVTKVGLIKFSSNGTVVHQPTTNYAQLITSISNLQPWWSTNFWDPLNDAKNYFDSNDAWFDKHIILLSDGLPTVGTWSLDAEEYAEEAADELKASGVRIYTISVEQTEEGINFMREISSASLVNLSVGRSTTQSSTQSSFNASRWVDTDKGNYTQTKSNANAWWQVDLGNQYEVREIKVWNRTNLTSDTRNFYVLGSPVPFTSTNLATTLAQSGVIATYHTWTAQRPSSFLFDDTIRYVRVQLAWTNRLRLAEVEVFGCDWSENCDWIFSFEDYTSEIISTLYGHIFWSIHCGCGPFQVCGICGDNVVDPTYGELCDEGSSCDDGTDCSADPSICPSECRPRTSQTCTQLCQMPSCGDGVVQAALGEQCDDANQKAGDGCSLTCQVEICGDDSVDENGADNIMGTEDDEHCDDGNIVNGDGCSSTCKSEFCGDGIMLGSELCDEWRSCEDGTDCTDNPRICPGECNTRFVNWCAADCTFGYCGDLSVDSDGANNIADDSDDEQCDPGKFCPNGVPCSHNESLCPGACEVKFTPTCTEHCKSTYCGDGFVDLDGVDDDVLTTHDNEQCDDGNGLSGDGCSSTCLLEAIEGCVGTDCSSTCGDGIKQFFEPCDPTDPSDENSATCTDLCTLSVCGDAIVRADEQCDGGKRCDDLVTSCTSDATVCPTWPTECRTRYINGCTEECISWCGDSILQEAGVDGILGTEDDEQCDDGNSRQSDSCTSTCKLPVCGDGIVTYYAQLPTATGTTVYFETCDDGNIDDGDDCPATCIWSGVAMTGQCNQQLSPFSFYNSNNFSFNDITQFCATGIPDGSPIFNEELEQWEWWCHGILWWADTACSLSSWSCGDGVVDVRVDPLLWTTIAEACDDGNNTNRDGCTALCAFESPFSFWSEQLCTAQHYPTVTMGELLPIWWEWTSSWIASGSCGDATTNTIIDESEILCTFGLSRWHPDGYVEQVWTMQVPCITDLTTMTGGALIRDAIIDQWGSPANIVGWAQIAPADLSEFVHYAQTIVYGQYRLDLTDIDFPYCAHTRTNRAWSSEVDENRELLSRTYSAESICAGSRTVLPGYLMQQKVLFSEQPNTWLDNTITNMAGEGVYLGDSSYDQTATLLTYTGPEKSYLFDQIIERYHPLATDPYTLATPNDSSTAFVKVPNTHVYIYTEQHDLLLERTHIEYLLMQAGVSSTETTTTPFTIIVPDSRAELHLIGTIPGRGMYIARDNMRFVPQSCDTSDTVQGLFVTNSEFYTDSLINDDPTASGRCNGGALIIDGLTLWGNISSTLGNTRRATLNLRQNAQQFYADETNVSYTLDQLYRTCFDIPLLSDALGKVSGQTSATYDGPFAWCTLENRPTYKEMQATERKQFFARLFQQNGFISKAVREQNTPVANAFLALLDNKENATNNSAAISMFTYADAVYTVQIPSRKIQQLDLAGKQLPSFWWGNVDLNNPQVREAFLDRLRSYVGPVGPLMRELTHPLQQSHDSVHQLLEKQWWSEYTLGLLAELDENETVCNPFFRWSDNILYTDKNSCLLTYTSVYKRMLENTVLATTQKNSKDKQILEWAAVQIRSAPFLRQNPPPGARDLLQALRISF